jgi:predicted nucleic acid-binding protein
MTMSVEPGIVDANILVYALDADAPQHVACRTLLEAAQGEAPVTLYVTPQILCEFYAIVTNARRVLKPSSSADALAAISDMLGFLRVLPVPVTVIDEVMALLRRRPVTGGEIFDLQIVATMKLNGISRIYTFNAGDFTPFSEIEPLTP